MTYYPYIRVFLVVLLAVAPVRMYARESSRLYALGVEHAREGRYREAEELFKESVTESPYYALAHYGLGRINLYSGGDIRIAIRELEIAVTLDQRLAHAHFYLGMAYYLDKKYIRAIKSFYRSYELDDRFIEALYNIGSLYDYTEHPIKSALFYKRYKDAREKEKRFDQ